jgi:sucrose-6-phosphate hydrolase SacC (GH32 family)
MPNNITRRHFLETAAWSGAISFAARSQLLAKETPQPFMAAHPELESFVEKIPKGDFYHETRRPRFHFTSYKNWISDPNGLVYCDGTYHLFFQYNPQGLFSKVPFWGHAESKDLVHWQQKPCLFPVSSSGSAVVDAENTTGLGQRGRPAIVVARGNSSWGYGIVRFAYSTDNAFSWREFESEPRLLDHADPKMLWHEPTQRWVMISFLWPKDPLTFRFYSSPDLKHWKLESTLRHTNSECPDLYELPIDGDPNRRKWVFNVGNGMYDIGQFDGKQFAIEHGRYRLDYGNFYASQTWSNLSQSANAGRAIHTAWLYGGGEHHGMPFNQQHTFPCELSLRTCPEGLRVCRRPIREIEKLYDKFYDWKDVLLRPDDCPLKDIKGEAFDIEAEFDLGNASEVGFEIRQHPVRIMTAEKKLMFLDSAAPVTIQNNRIRLRILIDTTSVEAFANQGETVLSRFFLPDPQARSLSVFAKGGVARIVALKIRTLRSIWPSVESVPSIPK